MMQWGLSFFIFLMVLKNSKSSLFFRLCYLIGSGNTRCFGGQVYQISSIVYVFNSVTFTYKERFYEPWWHGAMVIASASRVEDPGSYPTRTLVFWYGSMQY
jgi:predicted membrane channel-forming protein YqfA (hemolysin III family)